jgi:hypothetical protein
LLRVSRFHVDSFLNDTMVEESGLFFVSIAG